MRGRSGGVIRVLAGVLVLAVVLAAASPAAILDRLATADLALALAGIVGLTATHLVAAVGWRSLVGTMTGVWLPWGATIRLTYASQAVGGLTPANLGGDVLRAASLRGVGHGWSTAVAPLVLQRATSYLALSALSVVAIVFLAARAPLAGGIVLGGLAVTGVVALVAWLLVAPPPMMRGAHDRLVRWFGGGVDGGSLVLDRAPLIGMAHGLTFHAAAIGFTGLCVLAVEPAADIGPALAALAVARLALAMPLTPSGLGVQEGAAAILFEAAGLPPGAAVAALLLARLALVATTAIGGAVLQRHEALPPGLGESHRPGRATPRPAGPSTVR